jgi:hypothetical protein
MIAEKKEIINILSDMPEKIEIEELMYKLYVLEKIKNGINDSENGNTIPIEQLEEEIKTW